MRRHPVLAVLGQRRVRMQAQLAFQAGLGMRSNAPWSTGNRVADQHASRALLTHIAIDGAPVDLKPGCHRARRRACGNRRDDPFADV